MIKTMAIGAAGAGTSRSLQMERAVSNRGHHRTDFIRAAAARLSLSSQFPINGAPLWERWGVSMRGDQFPLRRSAVENCDKPNQAQNAYNKPTRKDSII